MCYLLSKLKHKVELYIHTYIPLDCSGDIFTPFFTTPNFHEYVSNSLKKYSFKFFNSLQSVCKFVVHWTSIVLVQTTDEMHSTSIQHTTHWCSKKLSASSKLFSAESVNLSISWKGSTHTRSSRAMVRCIPGSKMKERT